MKRIDLHIHTMATVSDSKGFEFDIEVLKDYVRTARLDAIAITNHNTFYRDDFDQISNEIGIPVFPGAELNISTTYNSFGHVLVIAKPDDIDDFQTGMRTFAEECPGNTDHVDWERVIEIFPKLSRWLVIPHYRKAKQLDSLTIEKIESSTGYDALEVSNAKKWLVESPNSSKSIVTFSDCRPGLRMPETDPDDSALRYSYGFTYIQCDEMSVTAIKNALANPRNVSVFRSNRDFEVLPESLPVSKRMNVILGERSSGKTFTLKRIRDAYDENDCLYIEQFEITNEAKKDVFDKEIEQEDKRFFDQYFKSLQSAIDEYFEFDVDTLEDAVRAYCSAVVRYAKSPSDEYSERPIYKSVEYDLTKSEARSKDDASLRLAIGQLLNDTERKDVIGEYVDFEKLQALEKRLRDLMKESHLDRWQRQKCNATVEAIKDELSKQSARKPLPSAEPLKDYFRYCYRQRRLAGLLDKLSDSKDLDSVPEYKYLKKRTRTMCNSPKQARQNASVQIPPHTDVASLFKPKISSSERLRVLRGFDPSVRGKACQLLFNIRSRIVLNDGSNASLSGGQRAEYLLIHKISGAAGKDVVLIDEPESSFDNPFLNGEVIRMLNDVADHSTVFLVTHNNSLGVSLKPDCVIYTTKERDGYHVYSGKLSSEKLIDVNGNTWSREKALLRTMEAGRDAYLDRRPYYGIA